jgi:uncharacterized membrane protein YesL
MTNKLPASLRIIGRSFVDWWDGWLDMVVVMLVWIAAQVTVIFGPPATFGLYYVAFRMINGEALGFRGLITGARIYFWKAWIWGIINIVVFFTLWINIYFYGSISSSWGVYVQVVIILLGVLWYCTQFYTLPYFMEQELKSVPVSLKNGLFTTLASPFYTLMIMIIVLIIIGVSTAFVIPLFLGLPGVIPILGIRAMYDRLEAFGLRKREKTPREIEYEESGKVEIPEKTYGSGESQSSNSNSTDGSESLEKSK